MDGQLSRVEWRATAAGTGGGGGGGAHGHRRRRLAVPTPLDAEMTGNFMQPPTASGPAVRSSIGGAHLRAVTQAGGPRWRSRRRATAH